MLARDFPIYSPEKSNPNPPPRRKMVVSSACIEEDRKQIWLHQVLLVDIWPQTRFLKLGMTAALFSSERFKVRTMLRCHSRPRIEEDFLALLACFVQPSFLNSCFMSLDQLVEEAPIFKDALASLPCFLTDFYRSWERGWSVIRTESVEGILIIIPVDLRQSCQFCQSWYTRFTRCL